MQTFIAVYYLKSVAQISKEDKAVGNRTSKSFYEWIFKNVRGCLDRQKCVNYTPFYSKEIELYIETFLLMKF